MANMNEAVTVLADESIGGVLREYHDVKRYARVGERVKIVSSAQRGEYPIGAIGTCTRDNQFDDGSIDTDIAEIDGDDHFIDTDYATYVVLEPTDVVVIEGNRYTLTKRKATQGERILVTKAGEGSSDGRYYRVGNVGTALRDGGTHNVYANLNGNAYVLDDGRWYVSNEDYTVLVAVETVSEQSETPTLDLVKQIEGLTETVGKLALRVTELERQGTAVKTTVPAVLPTIPVKPKPSRDQIVEKARVDVAELERIGGDTDARLDGASPFYATYFKTAYNVDKDSRKITAKVLYRYGSDEVRASATAKCAPDDCFNVHIGKAIALRRALGLPVPDEYLKAPQPTEPRIGDIVAGSMPAGSIYGSDKRFTLKSAYGKDAFYYAESPTDWIYRRQIGHILDDSCEVEPKSAAPAPANIKRTDLVTVVNPFATQAPSYFRKGEQYWVAEVADSSAYPYRLIRIGDGDKGGVWAATEAIDTATVDRLKDAA